MGQFWDWDNVNYIDGQGDLYLGPDRCSDSEKYTWFELGKSMWRKNPSTLHEHIKYTHNDIVKPLRFGTLQYSERIYEMHDLDK